MVGKVVHRLFLKNYLFGIKVNWLCLIYDFIHFFPRYTTGCKALNSEKKMPVSRKDYLFLKHGCKIYYQPSYD